MNCEFAGAILPGSELPDDRSEIGAKPVRNGMFGNSKVKCPKLLYGASSRRLLRGLTFAMNSFYETIEEHFRFGRVTVYPKS